MKLIAIATAMLVAVVCSSSAQALPSASTLAPLAQIEQGQAIEVGGHYSRNKTVHRNRSAYRQHRGHARGYSRGYSNRGHARGYSRGYSNRGHVRSYSHGRRNHGYSRGHYRRGYGGRRH